MRRWRGKRRPVDYLGLRRCKPTSRPPPQRLRLVCRLLPRLVTPHDVLRRRLRRRHLVALDPRRLRLLLRHHAPCLPLPRLPGHLVPRLSAAPLRCASARGSPQHPCCDSLLRKRVWDQFDGQAVPHGSSRAGTRGGRCRIAPSGGGRALRHPRRSAGTHLAGRRGAAHRDHGRPRASGQPNPGRSHPAGGAGRRPAPQPP